MLNNLSLLLGGNGAFICGDGDKHLLGISIPESSLIIFNETLDSSIKKIRDVFNTYYDMQIKVLEIRPN